MQIFVEHSSSLVFLTYWLLLLSQTHESGCLQQSFLSGNIKTLLNDILNFEKIIYQDNITSDIQNVYLT